MIKYKSLILNFFKTSPHRYQIIDIARGILFFNMFFYHSMLFATQYRVIQTTIPNSIGWEIYQKLIAGSFFFLVGISLYFTNQHNITLKKITMRMIELIGSALIVTIVSIFLYPNSIIIFGILHSIALSYLLALYILKIKIPYKFITILGIIIIIIGIYYRSQLFDNPILVWTGLGIHVAPAFDYQPIFPWFGVVLIGLGLGKYIANFSQKIAISQNKTTLLLTLVGKHTLFLYLAHVPIILIFLEIIKQ